MTREVRATDIGWAGWGLAGGTLALVIAVMVIHVDNTRWPARTGLGLAAAAAIASLVAHLTGPRAKAMPPHGAADP